MQMYKCLSAGFPSEHQCVKIVQPCRDCLRKELQAEFSGSTLHVCAMAHTDIFKYFFFVCLLLASNLNIDKMSSVIYEMELFMKIMQAKSAVRI